jgi:predicted TIM-barrel fold metal-dependent hydrolase
MKLQHCLDARHAADWIPDETARHKALVENPAQLYGF